MSTLLTSSSITWHKNSHSGGNGACVEIAEIGDRTAVRDSKNPDSAFLTFHRNTWQHFIDGMVSRRLG
ncbi:hypothetical protein Sme01_31230 [Sphaerisporangium melleum]|uniref:DUF397 domain-containing protein n=1 Tax=Sphaerisporangium melleum TaxID=321316 RepID=A0A917R8U1_9ACTN|nr:DUF397 domain-containing protein [Sphaerisporangium melleum]GGK95799.1 hypothetical protein GCM10007964_42650 [Sphaerisporangium melleum]GII70647.1 hypothetical protein Sme01_31230 [Sphaerisporangium melleum]